MQSAFIYTTHTSQESMNSKKKICEMAKKIHD